MYKIKILSGCCASGRSLVEGDIYNIPDDVNDDDAKILIRLGRADGVETPAKKDKPKPKPDPDQEINSEVGSAAD